MVGLVEWEGLEQVQRTNRNRNITPWDRTIVQATTALRFLRRSEFLGSFVSIPTLSRGEFMGTSAQWRSPKNHLGYCVKVRSYPSYLPHFPTYCIANTAANLATDSYPYHPTLSSTRCLPNPPPHIFTQEE